MIKIRVKKPKINLEQQKQRRNRKNCRITRREVEQEYQKKGKVKIPVEKTTIEQECDIG